MLDIKYFKQIDEVLEVKGWDFHYKPHEPKLGGGYLDYHERRCSIFGLSMPHSIMYELYLVRVIEAINKKYASSKSFLHIEQGFNYMAVYESEEYRIGFDIEENPDDAKEKAIIYIMDHIKEKV